MNKSQLNALFFCFVLSISLRYQAHAAQPLQSAPNAEAQFVILTQPIKIKIAYGETVLVAGTKLPVISSDANTVRVNYMGQAQTIPATSVQFITIATATPIAQAPRLPALSPGSQNAPTNQRIISLRQGYDSHMQGGDITMRELQSLLSQHCTANVDLGGDGIEIYNGVRYLTDVNAAAASLGLRGISSRVQLATPGFPRSSMYYRAYDGMFEGHFNRIYLVTDAADKIACIQLVDEHPKRPPEHFSLDSTSNWSTYNFINARLRASDSVRVFVESKRDRDLIRIETRMYQGFWKHTGHFTSHPYEEMEITKLLVPIPFARIVLHCIENGLSKR
ncbi:MAG: hypothetical protein QOI04_1245 [Verrucomicrobiota bacterium]|jgi:hypothetical protein